MTCGMRLLTCAIGSLLAASTSYAPPRFRIEAGLGTVWIHPQLIANSEQLEGDNGNREAICGEIEVSNHTYAGFEIGKSDYPFINRQFNALPAVWPPAGRPGENGERSSMCDLNLMLKYSLGNVEESRILSGGHAAFCLGMGWYYDGERRWDGYIWDANQTTYVRIENHYVQHGGWRPAFLTAGVRLGFDVIRLRGLDLSCYNTLRFRLTDTNIEGYHQSLFDSNIALALGYTFN